MLVQSIHFTFAAEDAGKAESILRELRDESRKEHGLIRFDVGRSEEKPNVFAFAHIATEHFDRLVVHGVRMSGPTRPKNTSPAKCGLC